MKHGSMWELLQIGTALDPQGIYWDHKRNTGCANIQRDNSKKICRFRGCRARVVAFGMNGSIYMYIYDNPSPKDFPNWGPSI